VGPGGVDDFLEVGSAGKESKFETSPSVKSEGNGY